FGKHLDFIDSICQQRQDDMEIIHGSLDRSEGNCAVVYSDNYSSKFDVPRSMTSDAEPRSKILLYMEGDDIIGIKVDRQATDKALDRIRKVRSYFATNVAARKYYDAGPDVASCSDNGAKVWQAGVHQIVANLVPYVLVIQQNVSSANVSSHPAIFSNNAVQNHVVMSDPISACQVRAGYFTVEANA